MSISPEIVRALLNYDSCTGVFTWRARDSKWFKRDRDMLAFNKQFAGKRAGYVSADRGGYESRKVRILGKGYYEQHLAWLWMTDEPLPPEIDHENRDGTDNRWSNLCASDRGKNMRNKSMYAGSASGVTGVTWCKRSQKWQARCRVDGKIHSLGYFDRNDIDVAAMEVMEFRSEHGFNLKHGLEAAHYRKEVA